MSRIERRPVFSFPDSLLSQYFRIFGAKEIRRAIWVNES